MSQEFHPEDDGLIMLTGKQLMFGAGIEDYVVTIGTDGECEISELADNQIVCLPPSSEPLASSTNYKNYKGRQIPHVLVQIIALLVMSQY